MSNKRAMYRRFNKQLNKENSLEEQKRLATMKGNALGFAVAEYILKNTFSFKEEKIKEIKDKAIAESQRCSNEGVAFALSFYKDKIVRELPRNVLQKTNTILEQMCVIRKNDEYMLVTGLILSVLQSEYNFGSNKKKIGRADKFIKEIIKEYININTYPKKYCIEWYKKMI